MSLDRCCVEPLPGHQVSFRIDDQERTRWHFGNQYPRPFFYPLAAPGRHQSLTRMGHPGAPNHDHHRSVWFAHAKVLGIDFWSDSHDATIRQQQWLAYQNGEDECGMAVQLGWYDGHDPQPLMQQELIALLRPLSSDRSATGSGDRTRHSYVLETQSIFTPAAEQVELEQTSFGFFAVRVARNISAFFGDGQLTGSDGARGEPELFGKPNRWMDYSGTLAEPASSLSDPGDRPHGLFTAAGITYFDHPDNVSYPSKWHVREDGWMGASVCRDRALTISRDEPLRLRYLLHVHNGELDRREADNIASAFASLPAARVVKSSKKHTHFEIERVA